MKCSKQHKDIDMEIVSIDSSLFKIFLSFLVYSFDWSSFYPEVIAENAREGFPQQLLYKIYKL